MGENKFLKSRQYRKDLTTKIKMRNEMDRLIHLQYMEELAFKLFMENCGK